MRFEIYGVFITSTADPTLATARFAAQASAFFGPGAAIVRAVWNPSADGGLCCNFLWPLEIEADRFEAAVGQVADRFRAAPTDRVACSPLEDEEVGSVSAWLAAGGRADWFVAYVARSGGQPFHRDFFVEDPVDVPPG